MPFSGSSSNRGQLGYKLEGTYPTNYGVLQAGNGTLINFLSESLNFDIKTSSSKAIRSDRQVGDLIQTGASANGGFNAEHVYKDYDWAIQAAMQSDYTAYGTNGVSAALAVPSAIAAGSITWSTGQPTGNDALTNMKKGQWFSINPAAGSSAAVKAYLYGRAFRVSPTTAPTATVLTLDPATPIDTSIMNAPGTLTGCTFGTSYSWNGTTLKTYSLELGLMDVNQFFQYLGMAVSKWDVNISSGEIVSMGFEFLGKSGQLKQTTGLGTPTAAQTFTPANATKGVFDIFENGTSLSATTYIKSGKFTVDNTLRGLEAVGVFGFAGLGNGTQQVTGSLSVYFTDNTLYDKVLAGTATSLSIPVLDPLGNGYVYYFPRVKYTTGKVDLGGLDQDNMLDIEFQALPETDATSQWFGKSLVVFRVGT